MTNTAEDIIKIFNTAAKGSMNANKLMQAQYGRVIGLNPLSVQLDQLTILDADNLKLTRNVMDYETEITINGVRSPVTMHNGLVLNDYVTLLRVQNGSNYIIIDKEVK